MVKHGTPEYEDTKRRALQEIERLRREVINCAHCASLRAQMARLLDCIPPEPIKDKFQRLWEYIGPVRELPEHVKNVKKGE